MAINIITWLWGKKYSLADVVRLANVVRKYFRCEHRFHLFSDQIDANRALGDIHGHPIADRDLCDRACFCRLRMFDPTWQSWHGLEGKIISLDLDIVVVKDIDDLFAGDSTFKILKGANAVNPNPFNASIMMLRSGCHPEVWRDFSVEAASKTPFHEFPDDQGWIHHKLPAADGWQVGKPSGIYAFQKPGWPAGTALPDDARLVTFIGSRKPEQYRHLPWIQKYWTAAA